MLDVETEDAADKDRARKYKPHPQRFYGALEIRSPRFEEENEGAEDESLDAPFDLALVLLACLLDEHALAFSQNGVAIFIHLFPFLVVLAVTVEPLSADGVVNNACLIWQPVAHHVQKGIHLVVDELLVPIGQPRVLHLSALRLRLVLKLLGTLCRSLLVFCLIVH